MNVVALVVAGARPGCRARCRVDHDVGREREVEGLGEIEGGVVVTGQRTTADAVKRHAGPAAEARHESSTRRTPTRRSRGSSCARRCQADPSGTAGARRGTQVSGVAGHGLTDRIRRSAPARTATRRRAAVLQKLHRLKPGSTNRAGFQAIRRRHTACTTMYHATDATRATL